MSTISFLIGLSNEYAVEIGNFFTWYNSMGRRILDFLYGVFNSTFNVLLAIAVLVSIMYLVMSVYTITRKKQKSQEKKAKL